MDNLFKGKYSIQDFSKAVLANLCKSMPNKSPKDVLNVINSDEVQKDIKGQFDKLFHKDWSQRYKNMQPQNALAAAANVCAMNIGMEYSF